MHLFRRALFRDQSIIDVKERKNQMEKSVAAAHDALFALEREFAEKKELQVS